MIESRGVGQRAPTTLKNATAGPGADVIARAIEGAAAAGEVSRRWAAGVGWRAGGTSPWDDRLVCRRRAL